MKDNTDRMDKAIKDKLNGHEAHVPSNLWKSIESKLPPEPGNKGGALFKNPFIISFLALSILTTGIYLFRPVNKQQHTATTSGAVYSVPAHTSITQKTNTPSNKNSHTSSDDLKNITNESLHTTSTAEYVSNSKQTLSASGKNQSDSKISTLNNSTPANKHTDFTSNMRISPENAKHTNHTNTTAAATQNHFADQRTTTVINHTNTGNAGTKNNNHTSQENLIDKINLSALGTISSTGTGKKPDVNTDAAPDTGLQHNNTVNKNSEHLSADSETSQENNRTITVVDPENTTTNRDDAIALASQKHFSGEITDTANSTDNSVSNNTDSNNHAVENIAGIASVTRNNPQTEDTNAKNTNKSNSIQTEQNKNNQQGSADELSDVRAYFIDSMTVPDNPAIIASAANTINNKIDSVNTNKKIIDSNSTQQNPEAITTISEEQKRHTSAFLSKCSFDGFITPAFGYIYTAANTSTVSSEDSLNKFIQNRNQNTRTGSGITAGLRMNYALSKKIELGIGLQYSSMSQASYLSQKTLDSSYYTFQGYTKTDSIYDSIQGTYIHRQYFVKTDSSAINSFTTQTKKFIDQYQNFSIPIYIAYGYSVTDRLSLLARTSLLINYQLYSVTYLNETEDKIIGYHSRKNISLGGSFSIGGYYAFSRSCSVFAEPVVTYYFSNLFDKQAPIKQTLLMLGLQTGIRISF
ncbi:MAG: hypothetical protein ACTHJT_06105 [Cytophaga sp.]|uniref:hypothetical protein n=1 Tax=Cytophaga sp. TaxID=29535 RepID=UPI003F80F908